MSFQQGGGREFNGGHVALIGETGCGKHDLHSACASSLPMCLVPCTVGGWARRAGGHDRAPTLRCPAGSIHPWGQELPGSCGGLCARQRAKVRFYSRVSCHPEFQCLRSYPIHHVQSSCKALWSYFLTHRHVCSHCPALYFCTVP